MTEAAKGGMAEVQLSTLATTKAQNADVKKFAQQMIQDHTNANAELKQLAGKKNVTLPTDLDAEHKALKDKLSGLSGAEFDKEYVNAMVADHEKSVNLFKTQADGGTDAEAKAFAAKTLPKLQGHLDMVKGMQGKMK
jgi:putative membrane protein